MNLAVSDPHILGLLVSLGLGLLIGIERERSKGTGPTRAFAGVRTFTIVALTGCLCRVLDQHLDPAGPPLLVLVGAVLVGVFSAIAYWRDRSRDPGVTTELALFTTYLLGVTTVPEPAIAAGAGVVVALLLALRRPLHHLSRDLLSDADLRNGLLLAAAALVVLPLLPDSGPPWAPALNPHRVWRLVVLVLLLQAAGQVALRIFGPRGGLALSGFLSGFISSTATMAAMGQHARTHPALLQASANGALLSNLATVIQLALLAAAINPGLLRDIGWPLVGAAAGALVAALAGWRRSSKSAETASEPHAAAFQPWHAVGFAALMTGVTAWVSWMQSSVGSAAATVSVAIAGFADAHAAATAAFALMMQPGQTGVDVGLLMLLGISTNTVSKAIAATAGGGPQFLRRLLPGLVALLLGGWAGWWFGH